ncbi:MAG TPA: hypothetical protein VF184_11895 [Phycisphaeraceae bacterium]
MLGSYQKFAIAAGVCCGLAATTHAAWLAPTNGWDFEYEATSGQRPNELATDPWTRSGYDNNTSRLETDAVDPTRDVLYLYNFPTNASFSGYFSLTSGAGAGDGSGLLTIDVEFRIRAGSGTIPGDDQPQWALWLRRDDRQYVVRFARDRIIVNHTAENEEGVEEINFIPVLVDLGTTWHTVRLLVDSNQQLASVYLDGSNVALASGFNGHASPGNNNVAFGDGTSAVAGAVNFTFLRIANGELAAVPEPAAMTVMFGGALALAARRRSGRRA